MSISWRAALIARLNAVAAVADLVGADGEGDKAITWFTLNRGAGFPALLLSGISPGVEYTHDGPVGVEGPRVQADSYAHDPDAVEALAKAVRAAMEAGGDHDGWRFHPAQIEGEQTIDLGEQDGGKPLFRIQQDFIFYHEEL